MSQLTPAQQNAARLHAATEAYHSAVRAVANQPGLNLNSAQIINELSRRVNGENVDWQAPGRSFTEPQRETLLPLVKNLAAAESRFVAALKDIEGGSGSFAGRDPNASDSPRLAVITAAIRQRNTETPDAYKAALTAVASLPGAPDAVRAAATAERPAEPAPARPEPAPATLTPTSHEAASLLQTIERVAGSGGNLASGGARRSVEMGRRSDAQGHDQTAGRVAVAQLLENHFSNRSPDNRDANPQERAMGFDPRQPQNFRLVNQDGGASIDSARALEATKAFQTEKRLDPDGNVGPRTLRALGGRQPPERAPAPTRPSQPTAPTGTVAPPPTGEQVTQAMEAWARREIRNAPTAQDLAKIQPGQQGGEGVAVVGRFLQSIGISNGDPSPHWNNRNKEALQQFRENYRHLYRAEGVEPPTRPRSDNNEPITAADIKVLESLSRQRGEAEAFRARFPTNASVSPSTEGGTGPGSIPPQAQPQSQAPARASPGR
jgi:hypothetical protein